MSNGFFDLVDLVPFDVQFALAVDTRVSIFEVTNVVTDWMNDQFEERLGEEGLEDGFQTFGNVILQQRSGRVLRREEANEVETNSKEALSLRGSNRKLQQELSPNGNQIIVNGFLFTAELGGQALFTSEDSSDAKVPMGDILEMQRRMIQDDDAMDILKEALATRVEGLADINAYLNTQTQSGSTSSSTDDVQLKVVITIAVSVACLAFIFLLFAIVWAWTYDRRNNLAYHNEVKEDSNTEQESPSPSKRVVQARPPVQTIYPFHEKGGGHIDNDSIITDDIATSLTQYYASGLKDQPREMDNASVSSMGSYGYSLDGYAPTLATPMPSDMITQQMTDQMQ